MDASNTCKNQKLTFPDKIKSLPIVFSTCFWLSENYNKIKESNFVTKQTCNLAETTLKNSIDLATPLLDKFKYQVDQLDTLACNQLEKIENAFPIVKREPNQIYNQGKHLISSWTIQPAVEKLNDIKDVSEKNYHYVYDYTKFLEKTKILMNKFLDLAESYVEENLDDTYRGNNLKEINTFVAISERARILSLYLYSSLTDRVSSSLNAMMICIQNFIFSFVKLIEVFNIIKMCTCNKLQDKFYVTKDKIDLYKEYLDLLKKQFTVQDGRSLEQINSIEERTKIIVRRNIGNFLAIYRIINAKLENIKPVICENRIYQFTRRIVGDVYQLINKPDGSLIDLVNSLALECSYSINKIENIKKSLMGFNSWILLWVVPNFDAFGVLDEIDDDEFKEPKLLRERKPRSSIDLLLIDKVERYRTLFYLEDDYLDTHFRPIQAYETTTYTPNSKTNSPSSCSSCPSSTYGKSNSL